MATDTPTIPELLTLTPAANILTTCSAQTLDLMLARITCDEISPRCDETSTSVAAADAIDMLSGGPLRAVAMIVNALRAHDLPADYVERLDAIDAQVRVTDAERNEPR